MRDLLRTDAFPYGSQYYRAPSPQPEDWDRDLKRMADLGFNMVKFWAQWRWNHPEEDRFYFDDLDRLMDLSAEHGLEVMLNTIVDVAPAWIYRKYPDASMVTLDGRRIGPQTQPHRQIGGLGLCLCHEEAVAHMYRFLEATVERYRDHPALAIWNVGSEPELTQSMAEMRAWADDAAKIGDMLDYNEHAIRAFRGWLKKKYGSIDRLNVAWNRNYTAFDEAEVPKTRNTFNDVLDWRMFFVDVLGENVRRRFEVAERVRADGEVLVRGPHVMRGYWQRPELTQEALREGWFHTGDQGALDVAGVLSITGRLKETIRSGGKSVQPEEVEGALCRHPGVLEAAVVGLPDPEWGEVVAAAVVAAPGAALTPEQLAEHCRAELSPHKRPKLIRLVAALPRSHYGKVQRAKVKAALTGA